MAQARAAGRHGGSDPGERGAGASSPRSAGLESNLNINGDDSAWGWNVGLLFDLDANSRIGVSYRSKIKYSVAGNASFDHPTLPALPQHARALARPRSRRSVNAALVQRRRHRATSKSPDIGQHLVLPAPERSLGRHGRRAVDRVEQLQDAHVHAHEWRACSAARPENFDDVWRFSLGANYRYNDRLMLRGGLAYDMGPANDTDRTVRACRTRIGSGSRSARNTR